VPLVPVQHHRAHVAACLAEHGATGPVLGLAWDGAGLGPDGTLWGGEALLVDGARCRRVAHLRPFALPGGERAMREPRRVALGLLHQLAPDRAARFAAHAFDAGAARVLLAMLARGVGAPKTTSVGRLFDGIAALAGLRALASFQGQAATELEQAADGFADEPQDAYPLSPGDPAQADWRPLVRAVVDDRARGVAVGAVSARFHAALAGVAVTIARAAGVERVALAGGCFQNERLVRAVRAGLEARGFVVLVPQLYPPNDGGIALGQLAVAAARDAGKE